MQTANLLLLQLIAHLLADYTFQTKRMAINKDKKGFKGKMLKWHILIVFTTSALLGLDKLFIPFSAVIAIIHWCIDGCKPLLLKNKVTRHYTFFIDQALHLAIFTGVVFLYRSLNDWQLIDHRFLNTFTLGTAAVFLICTKPANIFIREVFNAYGIYFQGGEEDLPNAGRLIGMIERWLVLIFILFGQFSAVGFLIGAKSILRFKETSFLKTEYVLVGTLLSFGVAVVLGIFVKQLGLYFL